MSVEDDVSLNLSKNVLLRFEDFRLSGGERFIKFVFGEVICCDDILGNDCVSFGIGRIFGIAVVSVDVVGVVTAVDNAGDEAK